MSVALRFARASTSPALLRRRASIACSPAAKRLPRDSSTRAMSARRLSPWAANILPRRCQQASSAMGGGAEAGSGWWCACVFRRRFLRDELDIVVGSRHSYELAVDVLPQSVCLVALARLESCQRSSRCFAAALRSWRRWRRRWSWRKSRPTIVRSPRFCCTAWWLRRLVVRTPWARCPRRRRLEEAWWVVWAWTTQVVLAAGGLELRFSTRSLL